MLPRMAWVSLLLIVLAPATAAEERTSAEVPAVGGGAFTTPTEVDDTLAAPAVDDLLKRPARAARSAVDGSSRATIGPWLRTSASLAGVVALIVLLAWGYRVGTGAGSRFAGPGKIRGGGAIQVLGRVNLAPRQALHLVRIGPQLVLVGATHDALRSLAVFRDAELAAQLAGSQAKALPNSHAAEFEGCLEHELRSGPPPDTDAPDAGRALPDAVVQVLRRWRRTASPPG